MSRIRVSVTTALFTLILTPLIEAAPQTAKHNLGGSGINEFVIVDNDGGQTGRFEFWYNNTKQFGEGNLILWNGTRNYDGREDNDFGGGTQSDIDIFDPMGLFGPNVHEVTAASLAPFRATTFSTTDGQFEVGQTTYAKAGDDYVIYQWTVKNTGTTEVPAKLLFLIDWDLGGFEDDFIAEWNGGTNTVFQQTWDLDFTTGGMSLLEGDLHGHHLGLCCDLRSDDATQDAYFMGTGSTVTSIVDVDDYEVGVSADLGLILPGEEACVAFAQAMTTSGDPVISKTQLLTEIRLANETWSSITSPGGCPQKLTLNAGLNDAWYNPATDGQGFFITIFPDLGFVTLAWFTYDTVLPMMGATANLGDPGHRWLTALGTIDGNKSVMDISITSGGLFDTATDVTRTDGGTITLTFEGCNSGTVDYDIPSISKQGSIPIQRVANDRIALCEALNDP